MRRQASTQTTIAKGLRRYDPVSSAKRILPLSDPGTVEHILPENPSAAWESAFPPEHWERFVYRIGNLALLEPAMNRQVGNQDFVAKYNAYSQSKYVLSNRVPEEAGDAWTPEKLDARQARLARRAVHIWRSDYAA